MVFMGYIIVDLEATCWDKRSTIDRMEIIEIGAVILASSTGAIIKEFNSFIKPVSSPKLSDFCIQLTSIRQEDVDQAEYFWTVFPQFLEWIGNDPFYLCSWGAYDLNQFRQDCDRHKLPFPVSFENHINLKKEFSRLKGKAVGMKTALEMMKIPLEGTHHRGIDDAKNIAKLARIILPEIEAELNAFSKVIDQKKCTNCRVC
jgi:3'-5' exoribonuclease 1